MNPFTPIRYLGLFAWSWCLVALFASAPAAAQKVVNMSVVGHLGLGELGANPTCPISGIDLRVNEVWGWDGPAGQALALVGLCDGTAIVDVADPAAPAVLATVPGPRSVWRDIKTFGHYAYVVHDTVHATDPAGAAIGVQIIDLADPAFPVVATLADGFDRAHNLFIDEARAHLYVVGWNGSTHGFRIYDLAADPESPSFLGQWDERYVHDLSVRGTTAYAAALADGLWFVDVSDPAAPVTLDHVTYTQDLPGGGTLDQFTHNVWTDATGSVAVVTDEQVNQRVKVFDVADPAAAAKIAEYEALPGILPHNAFVLGERAYVSYYSEGAVVLDLSDPTAPCEIGYYDTFVGPGTEIGAWGIYPFTASGLLYVSDITGGLYVLELEPPAHAPVDLALVLDVSGSMAATAVGGGSPRIEVLKDAVELFLQTWRAFTRPEDRLGIVYFDSSVEPAFIDGAISTRFCPHHAAFVEDVRGRGAGGLTALGGGLLTAVRSFAPGADPRAVIVVTDGMQNVSPLVVEAGLEAVLFDLHDTLVAGPVPEGPWALLPGAADLVAGLQAAGIRLGIITNTPPGWTRVDLAARMEDPAFLDEFEVVVLSSEAGTWKPDPEIYFHALSLLAAPPPAAHAAFVTETLAHIGDAAESPTEGARAAGMVGIHLSAAPPSPLADHTVAALGEIAAIVADSAVPPRHEVVTAPLGAGVFAESGVPGEPGTALSELGPTVHTIGIGTVAGSAWQELIEDLAGETAGLHHFTSAPDAELQSFLEDDLVTALQSGSVYRVARRSGSLASGGAETLELDLDPAVSKLLVRLSWRGARRPGLLRLELLPEPAPGETAVPLAASRTIEGSFYRVATWEFPLWEDGAPRPATGRWRVRVSAPDQLPAAGPIPYAVSVLVDDPRLKVRVEAGEEALATGRPVPLAAKLTLDGAPLAGATVRLRVTRPGTGLGSALARAGAPGSRPGGDLGTERTGALELRLRELAREQDFRRLLDPESGEIVLEEVETGRFRGHIPEARIPGSYRFDWRATGRVDGEPFERSGTFFRTVRVREFGATGIELEASRREDGSRRVRFSVTPRDRFGNHLGPGYADRLQVVIPGEGAPVPLVDRLDGTYTGEVVLGDPAALREAGVLILGRRLELPRDQVARIAGAGRGSLAFHLGRAEPEGRFGFGIERGPAAAIDLHRPLSRAGGRRWSLGLRLAWASFDGTAGGRFDHLALHPELRWLGAGAGLRPFAEAGPGVDLLDGDDVEAGFHAGAGLRAPLPGPWSWELALRYFHTPSGEPEARFFALQVGLRRHLRGRP